MTEYYELILNHRAYGDDGYDPFIEQPIVIKGFTSPLMTKSECDEREVLIDEMIDEMRHKVKYHFMQKRKVR